MPTETRYYNLALNGAVDAVSLTSTGIYAAATVFWTIEAPKNAATQPGQVEFEVIINYDTQRQLDDFDIQTVEQPRGSGTERRLRIVTPASTDYDPQERHPRTRINVRLPPGITHLDALLMNGPVYITDVTLPSATFDVRQVDIQTTAAPLTIHDLLADQVNLEATSGSVTMLSGTVRENLDISVTSGALVLKWLNAGDVTLNSQTGKVDANLGVIQKKSNNRTKVTVAAQTGAISLKYFEHDPLQILDSDVSTTTGAATVTHAPAFEGTFHCQTNIGTNAANPAEGKNASGESRVIEWTPQQQRGLFGMGGNSSSGAVWWGSNKANNGGSTRVVTNVGTAKLHLPC